MDKFFEKKNLGIPASLLVVLVYFVGYYITVDYSGLLVALVLAAAVFSLDFEDRLKTAVRQSFTVALFCSLINLGLSAIYQLSNLSVRIYILNSIFSNLYTYAQTLFSLAVIVVFAIFIIMALINKDIKLSFLLGEGIPKQKSAPQQKPAPQQMPPVYQQPVPQQPIPPMPQQTMYHQPVPPMPQHAPVQAPQAAPVQQPVQAPQAAPARQPVQAPQAAPAQPAQNIICPKCQAVNHAGAIFCGSCGSKL